MTSTPESTVTRPYDRNRDALVDVDLLHRAGITLVDVPVGGMPAPFIVVDRAALTDALDQAPDTLTTRLLRASARLPMPGPCLTPTCRPNDPECECR